MRSAQAIEVREPLAKIEDVRMIAAEPERRCRGDPASSPQLVRNGRPGCGRSRQSGGLVPMEVQGFSNSESSASGEKWSVVDGGQSEQTSQFWRIAPNINSSKMGATTMAVRYRQVGHADGKLVLDHLVNRMVFRVSQMRVATC